MPSTQQAKEIRLQHHPKGRVTLGYDANSTFSLHNVELPAPKDGEALVEYLQWSCDPAQSAWLAWNRDPRRLYRPPIKTGELVATAAAIVRVLQISGESDAIKEGDLAIVYNGGWATHGIFGLSDVHKTESFEGFPVSINIGVLGVVGWTAYFSIFDTLKLKPGESILISGAAGGVGSVAVQLAKHVAKAGLVIALAGTKEKVEWVKSLGADIAINYKDHDWKEQLIKASPDFLNTFLDNVGGETLSIGLSRMGFRGRISAIGSINNYNADYEAEASKPEVGYWYDVLIQRLTIYGTIVNDYVGRFEEATAFLQKAYKDGHLKLEGSETLVQADFEDVPKVWDGLYEGKNRGKLITQLKGTTV